MSAKKDARVFDNLKVGRAPSMPNL